MINNSRQKWRALFGEVEREMVEVKVNVVAVVMRKLKIEKTSKLVRQRNVTEKHLRMIMNLVQENG